MYVIFNTDKEPGDKIMACFYDNLDEQCDLMHRSDIDKQVKKWQKSNLGQPPKMYSRINIKEFISDKEAVKRNIKY